MPGRTMAVRTAPLLAFVTAFSCGTRHAACGIGFTLAFSSAGSIASPSSQMPDV
jgi:hypothetical protein